MSHFLFLSSECMTLKTIWRNLGYIKNFSLLFPSTFRINSCKINFEKLNSIREPKALMAPVLNIETSFGPDLLLEIQLPNTWANYFWQGGSSFLMVRGNDPSYPMWSKTSWVWYTSISIEYSGMSLIWSDSRITLSEIRIFFPCIVASRYFYSLSSYLAIALLQKYLIKF